MTVNTWQYKKLIIATTKTTINSFIIINGSVRHQADDGNSSPAAAYQSNTMAVGLPPDFALIRARVECAPAAWTGQPGQLTNEGRSFELIVHTNTSQNQRERERERKRESSNESI